MCDFHILPVILKRDVLNISAPISTSVHVNSQDYTITGCLSLEGNSGDHLVPAQAGPPGDGCLDSHRLSGHG